MSLPNPILQDIANFVTAVTACVLLLILAGAITFAIGRKNAINDKYKNGMM